MHALHKITALKPLDFHQSLIYHNLTRNGGLIIVMHRAHPLDEIT